MKPTELLDIITRGETSKVQFKERLPHQDAVAQEMVAFSNSTGGIIVIGVNDKTNNLNGLSYQEIQNTNQQLASIASQHVAPPIFITTDTITVNGHNLVVASIDEGISKPYKDRNGIIYKKNGADKRKVTDTNEILRLIQSSKIIYADETQVHESTIADLNLPKFKAFVNKRYNKDLEELGLPLEKVLENLRLLKSGNLTLAGLLLFAYNREKYRPLFSVQCVAVYDNVLIGNNYTDTEYALDGTIPEVYEATLAFIKRNLKKVQSGDSFNSLAVPEVPYQVFEEVLVNALVHRDYFINATVKVFIFTNRIEITSPGTLPNSLTIDNIIYGISVPRNPVLQSLAQFELPYRGIGTGIRRAIGLYPDISFINSKEEERFTVIIKRHV